MAWLGNEIMVYEYIVSGQGQSVYVYSKVTNSKLAQYCKQQFSSYWKVTVICLSIVCYTCMSAWQEMTYLILQCQQETLHAISVPTRYPACYLHADQMLFLPSPFQQETLHVISMPIRYNAWHRNVSKGPCHLHAALPAILRIASYPTCHIHASIRDPASYFWANEIPLHAVSMPTRYPACYLHANKSIHFNSLFGSIQEKCLAFFLS